MTDSIHAALWEWFSQCSTITKRFFNFSTAENSDTVISTAGDVLLQDFIDDSQQRRYSFELSRFCPVTFTANDPGNVEMLEDVQTISKWVEDQNALGNLPILPNEYCAERIFVLDEYAGIVTAQNSNTAKYMIPFALDYTKPKG